MGSTQTSEDASSSNQSSARGLAVRTRRLKGTTISPIIVSELPPREGVTQTHLEIPEPNELELPGIGRFHLKAEDLLVHEELGSGNSGMVNVVVHKPTVYKMAVKTIQLNTGESVYRQIVRELRIMHQCGSHCIVAFYGALLGQGEVSLCMEYMDVGSFDQIVKAIGTIPVDILGKTTYSVLSGLVYLYTNHKIIHRDIKPSNILLNMNGQIKVSDFGVSVQLIDSIAQTFVGTSAYMSPERIEGSKYSVRSDAWSVGITLMELAIGRSPFLLEGDQLGVFDLLQLIVREPSPTLPPGKFSPDFEQFLARCLIKDPTQRPSPLELLKDPYCIRVANEDVDVKAWAQNIQNIVKIKSKC